nr:thioredoxin fold domain-containing protein [uncultured Sediminibacterium sp.]
MKIRKFISLTCLLFALSVNCIPAQESIRFEHLKYEEIIEKSKREKKPVLIYFTGTGCFLCVKMEKNVFPKPEISQFYNTNFINVESFDDFKKPDSATKQLRRRYGIISNPTFIFTDSTGTIIHKSGYKETEQFLLTGKQAISNDNYKVWKEKIDAGYADASLMLNYLSAEQKPALYANDNYNCMAQIALDRYFDMIPEKDYVLPQNWLIIENYVANPFSKIFTYLLEHQPLFDQQNGHERVNKAIYTILREGLMINEDEAHRKRAELLVNSSNHPMAALVQKIRTLNNTDLNKAINDKKQIAYMTLQYDSLMNHYSYLLPALQVNNFVRNLCESAAKINTDILNKCNKWMSLIISKPENQDYDFYDTYALSCFLTNNFKEAVQAQENSIALAVQDKLDSEELLPYKKALEKYKKALQ